ncbi:MAG: SDR family NAD(P)-dependent oxidoreductase [Planctomycetes bacterium]|nr:SDR family NAD(P)-dependent oxidoreductase [Planctomycetota bacterium]
MTASVDNSTSPRPVALVTGASSGIGRAIAMQLAAEGHAVALAARREAPLQEVAAAIRSAGGEALVVPCDATDAAAVQQLVAHVLRHFGRLDVVVASAGAYLRKPALDTTRADVEQMLAANFWSGFELVQAALPILTAQRRGRLLLIASFDAVVGMPRDAAYVAAKCALRGWAGVVRQGLRGTGVTLTTALPGRVDTPMIDDLEVPAISAKVSAERVARAALRGMRRGKAEVIVPWHIRLLQWASVLSPRLGDWLVRRLGLDGRIATTRRS